MNDYLDGRSNSYLTYASNKQHWENFVIKNTMLDFTDTENYSFNLWTKILWRSFSNETRKGIYLSQAYWYAERTGIEIK